MLFFFKFNPQTQFRPAKFHKSAIPDRRGMAKKKQINVDPVFFQTVRNDKNKNVLRVSVAI